MRKEEAVNQIIITIMKINSLIDIHLHLLPNVDDGPKSFDESLSMIKKMESENIKNLIITPHFQNEAQKKTLEEQVIIFNELEKLVKNNKINVDLYLGVELRYKSHLKPNYEKLTLNKSSYILLEFSSSNEEPINDIIYNFVKNGFIPIVAHIERYPYLNYNDYIKIKESGGLIQVNSGTVLGNYGRKLKKLTFKMLKDNLIDFIASDAHGFEKRESTLRKAYDLLINKFDNNYINKIFYDNGLKIIKSE